MFSCSQDIEWTPTAVGRGRDRPCTPSPIIVDEGTTGAGMQNETGPSVERKPWPGPFGVDTDGEAYIYDAMQPFLTNWRWDDPEGRATVSKILIADQLAVWATSNIDGQIDSRGSVRAGSNSYGELC